MAIKVEHELHARRRGRNQGLGLILASLVAIVLGLTIVKVQALDGNIVQMEASDHVLRPGLLPEDDEGE